MRESNLVKCLSLPGQRSTAANSTYKKLAVQWLNEALCLVLSSVVSDSLELRNSQLLLAASCVIIKMKYEFTKC
jgi:hypothetical protein